jgi:hypothetical protein
VADAGQLGKRPSIGRKGERRLQVDPAFVVHEAVSSIRESDYFEPNPIAAMELRGPAIQGMDQPLSNRAEADDPHTNGTVL